jgi:[ribosomal protein S18]-alanine N-acetyltransferase
MLKPEITSATGEEREWSAQLLSTSEPWLTLGITIEKCRKSCNDPEYQVFIAHEKGKPCGVIILDPRGVASSPYVKSIAVSPGYRSSGIGAALMEFAEMLYNGQSRFIFLCVSSFNHRAREFYARLGYKVVGELNNFIIDGKSEILMYKELL